MDFTLGRPTRLDAHAALFHDARVVADGSAVLVLVRGADGAIGRRRRERVRGRGRGREDDARRERRRIWVREGRVPRPRPRDAAARQRRRGRAPEVVGLVAGVGGAGRATARGFVVTRAHERDGSARGTRRARRVGQDPRRIGRRTAPPPPSRDPTAANASRSRPRARPRRRRRVRSTGRREMATGARKATPQSPRPELWRPPRARRRQSGRATRRVFPGAAARARAVSGRAHQQMTRGRVSRTLLVPV